MKDYLASGNNCNICKSVMPNFFYQGLSNNSRFTVSVDDGRFAISTRPNLTRF